MPWRHSQTTIDSVSTSSVVMWNTKMASATRAESVMPHRQSAANTSSSISTPSVVIVSG